MYYYARFISMDNLENHLESAAKTAQLGNVKGQVEAFLFAIGTGKIIFRNAKTTFIHMKHRLTYQEESLF
jgi:hypothetical protein